MDVSLHHALELLSRTPATLQALLRGLPRDWVSSNEGPETWSPFDVIGHLIHCELTDWIPRAEIILEHGESRAFDPFDRFAQFEASRGKTLEELLVEFASLRAHNLQRLRDLIPEETTFGKTGMHPELGRVTLGELIATWVTHDLDHIAQIARTMAKQYTNEVGPWKAYISILHDRRPS